MNKIQAKTVNISLKYLIKVRFLRLLISYISRDFEQAVQSLENWNRTTLLTSQSSKHGTSAK